MAKVLAKLDRHGVSRNSANGNSLLGRRVLVVDDSAPQRKRLRELYESLGLVCVGEAADGLECLTFLDRFAVDLVSLDVLMPVMHGLETLRYLRSSHPNILVIFMSVLEDIEGIPDFQEDELLPDGIFQKADSKEVLFQGLHEIFLAENSKQPHDGNDGVNDVVA